MENIFHLKIPTGAKALVSYYLLKNKLSIAQKINLGINDQHQRCFQKRHAMSYF